VYDCRSVALGLLCYKKESGHANTSENLGVALHITSSFGPSKREYEINKLGHVSSTIFALGVKK